MTTWLGCNTMPSLASNIVRRGPPCQQLGQHARAGRIQVLDHDDGQTGVHGHCRKELADRLQAASRRARLPTTGTAVVSPSRAGLRCRGVDFFSSCGLRHGLIARDLQLSVSTFAL